MPLTQPLAFALSLGPTMSASDPTLQYYGLRGGLTVQVAPPFEVGLDVTVWPKATDASGELALPVPFDYESSIFGCPPMTEGCVYGDLSVVDGEAEFTLRYFPVSAVMGRWRGRAGVDAGFGALHSVDDYGLQLGAPDPVFEATRRQWHPTTPLGFVVEVHHGALGLRFRGDSVGYIETVNSGTLEMKHMFSMGLELAFWWGGAESPGP